MARGRNSRIEISEVMAITDITRPTAGSSSIFDATTLPANTPIATSEQRIALSVNAVARTGSSISASRTM